MRSLKLSAVPATALALALVAIAVPAIADNKADDPQAQRATKTVAVGDDYYAPTSLKVPKGTKVKWKWQPINTNPHNVTLTKTHPKGVKPKDYTSANGSIGVKFARKFKVPGKYEFICTFHKSVMRMDLKVKK